MTINQVISTLEELAPTAYAEDFDNVGLLVGDKTAEVSGILVTLDTLEETIEEAIQQDCNLIVSFHPIIFKGLKKITGKSYVERVVLKAIKHDIAIYAIHTALDNSFKGVNHQICEEIGLVNRQVLVPQPQTIKKLVAHVPHKNVEEVRDALFNAGAGSIGNYDDCSFNISGKGTFKANEEANPTLGEIGKLHIEEEKQLHLTYPRHVESKVLKALFNTHPYEEVAYEITTLENKNQRIGIGMMGELPQAESEVEFLERIKKTFHLKVIRHSKLLNKEIKKVAVLGGSGAFAIPNAKALQADIYITADLKYHDFYQAENQLVLADIGHYESEQYTKNLLHSYLTKKFRNFAVVLSQKSTNPIQYS